MAIDTEAVGGWERHEVSILRAGAYRGWQPASNVSMTIMRPPPQGHAVASFGKHAHLADTEAFAAFLAPLKRTRWFVYSKRPFAGPEAVLAYLARYTHRVAISNSRLIKADASTVTFKVKDYRIEGPGR